MRPEADAVQHVEVVPYDPAWPQRFARERDCIRDILGAVALDIQHVGSTSVPGLRAKPIVDIAVLVPTFDEANPFFKALANIGYFYEPAYESEVPNRRYFSKGSHFPERAHLHMYEDGDPDFTDYILFRDWLRSRPDVARDYEALKLDLSTELARAQYTHAKAPFIQEILRAARAARS